MKDLVTKLAKIQQELKAPKNQFNSFSNFKYRSCEDIMEAVKPLLGNLILTVSDEIVQIGDRYYVKASASLSDGTSDIINSAYAREPLSKKGMDESQITGATSSYARKYALNGLFAIDDTKDADSQDNRPAKKLSKDEQIINEVVEKGLETMEKPWCKLHNKEMKSKYLNEDEEVIGHWRKVGNDWELCQGEGFHKFNNAK